MRYFRKYTSGLILILTAAKGQDPVQVNGKKGVILLGKASLGMLSPFLL